MSRRMVTRGRRDRGAVLVHVAVAMMALVAFSALTIDYGIMWMSRRQAQNAADAGALAGAVSLAFDDPEDFERSRAMAETLAESHTIFGLPPDVNRGAGNGEDADTTQDISYPTCPPDTLGIAGTCIRVNVYRTEAAFTQGQGTKDPLPSFFGPVFGRLQQGVRATATAKILSGNASDCLKPWAVADRWDENVKRVCNNGQPPPCNNGTWQPNPDPWTLADTYDKWTLSNPPVLDPDIPASGNTPDDYVPPTDGDPGTGFGLYNPDGSLKDYGQPLAMKAGCGTQNVSSGWFMMLDLSEICTAPGCPTNQGADTYRWTIKNCVGGVKGIGDTLPVQTGCASGPTGQGVYEAVGGQSLSLYELDPGATWNESTKQIEGSCAPGICADEQFHAVSPRIVPVSLFDLDQYLASGFNGSGGEVVITNIFGFFILSREQAEGMGLRDAQGQGQAADEVYGVMVAVPGLATNSTTQTSSFIQKVILVR